jgi:hypothetical protein
VVAVFKKVLACISEEVIESEHFLTAKSQTFPHTVIFDFVCGDDGATVRTGTSGDAHGYTLGVLTDDESMIFRELTVHILRCGSATDQTVDDPAPRRNLSIVDNDAVPHMAFRIVEFSPIAVYGPRHVPASTVVFSAINTGRGRPLHT